MARTGMKATRTPAETPGLLNLEVVARARLSPTFARITLGGGDVGGFRSQGFDQWFRLFLPVAGGSLERVPPTLDTLSYLRFLTVSKSRRPVLRNYTVAGFRAEGTDGPELDVDLVLHGDDPATAGPASRWAATCEVGAQVALLDEGTVFPRQPVEHVVLVADESAVPAAAGILASLPGSVRGTAVLEVPVADDCRELTAPAGVDVRWVVRGAGSHELPGRAAVAALGEVGAPPSAVCWVAGEQTLARDARRHWVGAGVPADQVSFTGYWKAGKH